MQTKHAADYANRLLTSLDCARRVDLNADHPAIAYKRSGLLGVTGLMLPLPLVSHVDGAMMALRALSPWPEALPNRGSILLAERARLRDTVRKGRLCAGGYGRLMDTKNGRIALNLVRPDDWGLVPAWLEEDVTDWAGVVQCVATKEANYLVNRAAEIGLAVAKDHLPDRPDCWFNLHRYEPASTIKRPLIVDLSGLWAGPLSTSLLQACGAKVIKVEGPNRPDGMRFGHAGFYELINSGKDCVALDFSDAQDLAALKTLLEKADVVIEASRPRAMRQLGIVADAFVAQKPGKIWVRLTAYGQSENRIGFGDDIGIAAGLASVMDAAHAEPCFVGDAIADPVNGVHIALAVRALLGQGGGAVIDLAMRDVLRFAMGDTPDNAAKVATDWLCIAKADEQALYPMRAPSGVTKDVGQDNEVWL